MNLQDMTNLNIHLSRKGTNMTAKTIVLVTGGFDPLHSGHIKYLESAGEDNYLVVGLNSDDWLARKKGKPFMPFIMLMGVIVTNKKLLSGQDTATTQRLRFNGAWEVLIKRTPAAGFLMSGMRRKLLSDLGDLGECILTNKQSRLKNLSLSHSRA